ncbi:hypothetical protein [Streptomyces sp. HPF1205]|uniref:hypothetical protein n=1 Tax=Streptomyces sp. HPF1205 TaxID=2873262 RepID=UPI001CED4DDA|nr:hypothetical protein [Streptomyces sp. HPF1205]
MDHADVPPKPARPPAIPPTSPQHPDHAEHSDHAGPGHSGHPGAGPGAPAGPGPGATPGAGRRRPPRTALIAGALAAAVVVALLLAHAVDGGDGDPDAPHHGAATARLTGADGFPGDAAGLVVLDGVSGRVQVTADRDAHEVTGSFHRQDGAFASLRGTLAHDPSSGTDALTVHCADASGTEEPCAGDLYLTVPPRTGLRLRQTSGETTLSGLGGDVSVDASSVRLSTFGLHPAHAAVTVFSGSADLGFTGAPTSLDLHATSASVALRLPRTADGYAVTTAAASADVQVGVERDPAAAHHVALTVTSASLSVQNT